MDFEEIKEKWALKEKNKQASVEMWDSMAQSFGDHAAVDFKENGFLKLLESQGMFKSDSRVLDVGCGTGTYARAIAGRCSEVVGVDLSPKMVNLAEEKKRQEQIGNALFSCIDWHHADLAEAGFENSFDLVIAHMTPAVQSAETFLKLSQASRGWCVMSKPTRRVDPVSDEIKKLAGITEKRESSDKDMLYAFELLWLQGLQPRFEYEKQRWNMKKTLEEAYGLYINRVRTYKDITDQEEKQMREYLQSIAKAGLVYEDVDTTITTIYWHV